MSSKNEKIAIEAMMIVEVIGRPPEHLIEILEEIIKNIDNEKGVCVKGKKIKEPTLMKMDSPKNTQEIYTSFAEVTIEVEDILYLAILMFKYMPAHIEIIHPELIALTNNGWNDIFNELTRRLHGYDEIARILQFEKSILERRLRDALGHQKIPEKTEEKTGIKEKEISKKEKPKKKSSKYKKSDRKKR